MRKFLQVTSAALLSALAVFIVAANAGPSPLGVGIGITWSADFAGNGSAGSPIEMSSNVTMPGLAQVAGTPGTTTFQAYSTDRNAIYGERGVTASTQDDRSAIYGYTYGTMAVSTGDKYSYGVRGDNFVTNSTVGGNLHSWGVFGRSGTKDVTATSVYEAVGVEGVAGAGATYGIGGSFRAGGGTGSATIMGMTAQADTLGTGPTIGAYGYARTGPVRVGVAGVAYNGGTAPTTNIGVYGSSSLYTESFPTGAYAGYFAGPTQTTDDATFESGTCVINSAGISCGGSAITGDITGVTANAPISGGGTSGSVAIGLTACSDTQIYKMSGGVWTCSADGGGGVTNSAGNNVITKSDGTNLVASSVTDNGTTFAIATNKLTVTEASGNTAIAGTLNVTGQIASNFALNTGAFRTEPTPAAGTSNIIAVYTSPQGTLDATAASRSSYAVYAVPQTSRSAGANNVTNYGIYADASNGTVNYSGYFASGSFHVGGVADFGSTVAVTGDFAVNTNKFTVAASSGNTLVAGTLGVTSTTSTQYLNGTTHPTISSCGAGASVEAHANNMGGTFTVGTGSSGCLVTFSGSGFPIHPFCMVTKVVSPPTNVALSESSSSMTFAAGDVVDGATYKYLCFGGNN